jgi:glycosidase
MNYDFRRHSRDFFALGAIDAAAFNTRVTQMLMRYPAGVVQGQLNLLDSHDVSRFLSLCGEDTRRYKLAVLFLAMFPGVPSVFYGDELGFTGIEEQEYRQAMQWDSDSNMTEFFRQVMRLRCNSAVTHGDYMVSHAEKDEKIYAFKRSDGKQAVTLLLNAGDSPKSVVEDTYPAQTPFLEQGWENSCIDGYGYVVWVQ